LVVWDTIEKMCNTSMSADVAIDLIYAECGGEGTPVGRIVERLRDFRKVGNQNLFIAPEPSRNVRNPLART